MATRIKTGITVQAISMGVLWVVRVLCGWLFSLKRTIT